ncbi:MAG: hypothetical protein V1492_01460 [Candidatus Micrarchaeota archaeon]
MEKKYIVCDSGSLITLTSACNTDLLYFFKNKFNVNFVIPSGVEDEVVTYPLGKGIKKYMQSALRIKNAINDGVITVLGIEQTAHDRDSILTMGNNLFFARGKSIKLLDLGETEMLALAKEIGADTVMLDERTMRMLIEAPFRLKEHMEEELKVNIMVNRTNLNEFSNYAKGLLALRSSELIILGYEHGFFDKFHGMEKQALEAALYSARFSGCSISFNEITGYLRWAK